MQRRIGLLSLFVASGSLFFGLVPMVLYGIVHIGTIGMVLYGGALLWVLHSAKRPYPKSIRQISRVLSWCLAAFFVAGAALSVFMARAAWFRPPAGTCTVIVPGCQIISDQPSKMLLGRLDAAKEYLDSHPDAPVVCSGGFGAAQVFSEAEVMKKVLRDAGIPQEQIYPEDASRNTQENIQFSSAIIRQRQLPACVVIATSEFHQLRAQWYASQNKLTVFGLSSPTPWGLLPSYWIREWFALIDAAAENPFLPYRSHF